MASDLTVVRPDIKMKEVVIALFSNMLTATPSAPWLSADFADKTVQVFAGAGAGNIVIEGSNDPRVLTSPGTAVWVTAKDTDNVALSYAAATGGAATIRDNFYFLRANVTGTVTAGTVAISGKRTY